VKGWIASMIAVAWVLTAVCLVNPSHAAEDWASLVPTLRAQWVANPDDPEVRRQLAIALHNHAVDLAGQGQWDLAVFHGEEALSLAPGDAVLRRGLAQIYLGKAFQLHDRAADGGRPPARAGAEDPTENARKALEVDPTLAPAQVLLGDLRYERGAAEDAKTAWEAARRLDPGLAGLGERLALFGPGGDGPGSSPSPACDPQEWADRVEHRRAAFRRAPADPSHRTGLAQALHGAGACLTAKQRWEEAVTNLVAAARLTPGDTRLRKDLASAYVGQAQETYAALRAGRSNGRNETFLRTLLEQAIEVDPESAPAHLLLGDLAYEHQRLEDARRAWQRARELDPELPGMDARLAKLAGEFDAEVGMDLVSDAHFILQYAEDVRASVSYDVRGKLALARQQVGQQFGYWPERRIVVLLYAMKTYRSVKRDAPQWSGGQYDGKIRIPVPEATADLAAVEGIVFHEYTHAVIHELTGGNCPVWLNEGLAELASAERAGYDPLPRVRTAAAQGRLVPWNQLDRVFRSPSAEAARLAYDQSHSAVAYLSATYGFWKVRRILEDLGAGQSTEAAVEGELGFSLETLERDWRRRVGADR